MVTVGKKFDKDKTRQGEIQYLRKKHKILMRVSEVCVSAVYDLSSMYFISFTCSLGTIKLG